jgi:uncharacterized RDD family membrane protein YckC
MSLSPASSTPGPASHTPNPSTPASHTPSPASSPPGPASSTPGPASHTPNPSTPASSSLTPDSSSSTPAPAYAGLVTRIIAFALDAALVNGVALLVGVTVGLGVSILHLPKQVDAVVAVILGALWVIWLFGYFAFFWSTTGQTPGDRVMRIAVIDRHDRGPLRPLRAAMRFGGVILAAMPLFAGILIMLWDDRHRCLQDRLARTIVIYAPDSGPRSRLRSSGPSTPDPATREIGSPPRPRRMKAKPTAIMAPASGPTTYTQ